MCLGTPFEIVAVSGEKGRGKAFGLEKEIDLRMLEKVAVGDYVLVHAGFAVQKIDRDRAGETLRLFRDYLGRD